VEIDTGLSHLLRRRLRAQADLFAALTSHPTLIGAGRENALAELLRQFMPRRFEILQGTVAIVDEDQRPMRSTHQLDIIVADTMGFPTLLRSGNVAVVLAQSVRAVMEVKSNLRRGASFVSALIQIARARQLLASDAPVFTGLFSFGAPADPETLRDWLADLLELRQLLATKQGTPRIARIRDALLATEDEDVRVSDENALLKLLDNSNLPNVIAADRGAVTRKVGGQGASDFYMFLGRGRWPAVSHGRDRSPHRTARRHGTPSVNGALNDIRAHLAIEALPSGLDDLPLLDPAPTLSVAR
jgi:hypothetical protein